MVDISCDLGNYLWTFAPPSGQKQAVRLLPLTERSDLSL